MRAVYRALGGAAGIAILAACTGGQSAIEPPFTAVNVQAQSTLEFRVGTANWAGLATYTNTVVSFRQPNGLSATLFNTPTITAPAGFVVPAAGAAGVDAGTNRISGTPPTQPGTPAVATTFAQTGGAFSWGFAPANSTTAGTANYPGRPGGAAFGNSLGATNIINVYTQPIYNGNAGTTGRRPFVLGPPAVPDFHNPALGFPAGFLGYDSGFVAFAAAPVAGTYALHDEVPANVIGTLSAVFDVTATMATVTPLPVEATPVIAEVPAAGGAITVTVGAPPVGATTQVIYVVDVSSGGTATCYAIQANSAGTFTLAASNFTGSAGHTIWAYAVGANFDIVGNSAPNSTNPAPPLPAQTDITVSGRTNLLYV